MKLIARFVVIRLKVRGEISRYEQSCSLVNSGSSIDAAGTIVIGIFFFLTVTDTPSVYVSDECPGFRWETLRGLSGLRLLFNPPQSQTLRFVRVPSTCVRGEPLVC